MKWVGGAYLLYLGVGMLRAGASVTETASPTVPGSRWRVFATTYVVTALNPKSIVFFVAFLPQFINHDAHYTQQLRVLAIAFVAMATVSATLYAACAVSARELLASPLVQRRFNVVSGSLLSVAGVWGLLARRAL